MFPVLAKACIYTSNVPWILKRNIFVCGTLLSYHVPKLQRVSKCDWQIILWGEIYIKYI